MTFAPPTQGIRTRGKTEDREDGIRPNIGITPALTITDPTAQPHITPLPLGLIAMQHPMAMTAQ